eukprot:6203007-Pleurochrysis_carterae.AAC.3
MALQPSASRAHHSPDAWAGRACPCANADLERSSDTVAAEPRTDEMTACSPRQQASFQRASAPPSLRPDAVRVYFGTFLGSFRQRLAWRGALHVERGAVARRCGRRKWVAAARLPARRSASHAVKARAVKARAVKARAENARELQTWLRSRGQSCSRLSGAVRLVVLTPPRAAPARA